MNPVYIIAFCAICALIVLLMPTTPLQAQVAAQPQPQPQPQVSSVKHTETIVTEVPDVATAVVPVPVPTTVFSRGLPSKYIQIGYLSRRSRRARLLPLYGSRLYRGAYDYYTYVDDIALPLTTYGYAELSHGSYINVPGYHGRYLVNLY